MRSLSHLVIALAAVCCAVMVMSGPAPAHCDALDGPVVEAARRALSTGMAEHALIWVKPGASDELVRTFRQTLAVRALGTEARGLADRHFFETVVRLHRQGEGEGFTGLKPAGIDRGPVIPAADKAVATGSADELIHLVTHRVSNALRSRFAEVTELKAFAPDDIVKGRAFADAYVRFVHTAEALHGLTQSENGHAHQSKHP